MELHLLWSGEASRKELMLALLALLDQVSAAVDDLGFDEPLLVLFARALNHLHKSRHQLQTERATVAVHELLLIHCHHLGYVTDEVEALLVGRAVGVRLLS